MADATAPASAGPLRILPLGSLGTGRAGRLVERNLLVFRRSWIVVATGFLEPLFYLLSIGVGIGALVGGVAVGGRVVPYRDFLAPGMLAASAMNGAVYDSTINIFFKLKYQKLYDAVLSTPLGVGDIALGELAWALGRGGLYSAGFLVVMLGLGLVHSWWALLALPAALLVGASFAGAGLAATTFMRGWQDFDLVQLVILPMFLFSGTFYPLSTYPPALRVVVRCTPLYQAVAILRALVMGTPGWATLGHAAFLAVVGLVGLAIASRRMAKLLRS
jgi:lipooligosaccharide transport system permease protein